MAKKKRNPLDPNMRKYIAYCERYYFLHNSGFPTVDQAAFALNLPQVTIRHYLTLQPVQEALSERGLPWKSAGSRGANEEITHEQMAAALTVANFADERPIAQKLDELGILSVQYFAWLQDPKYAAFAQQVANSTLVNLRPTAIAELAKKVQKGDLKAIQYYLDSTGEFGNKNEVENLKVVIERLIEIVQKHVKDPDKLAAIASDILTTAPGIAEGAKPNLQIEGSIANDYSANDSEPEMINVSLLKGG